MSDTDTFLSEVPPADPAGTTPRSEDSTTGGASSTFDSANGTFGAANSTFDTASSAFGSENSTTGGQTNSTDSQSNGSPAPPLMDQAKQQAQKVVEQTQQKAGEVLDQAKTHSKSWAEDKKQAVAQSLSDVAMAVLQTGESLRGQSPDIGKFADMTDRAAEAADKAAGYLRDTSVDQMIGEVESFGRREPVLFLIGAAAIGFMAARFLKSSGRSVQSTPGYNPDRLLPVPSDNQF